MPKSSRKARAQHVRNHKRAAKRQAAQNQRSAGRKTLPVAQRNQGGMSIQVMRALGRLFMAEAGFSETPVAARPFTRQKKT